MTAPSDTTRPRLLALDWLRGIAVLVMVECHVFNALLAPAYRDSRWFAVFNWLNGFVAPAFLLVSGAVLGMNLQSRWDKGTGKLWRRVGQVFIVAYLLHLPTPLLWQFFGPRGPHLIELWTKQDILQCVAGSLALILALVPVTRKPAIHRVVCLVLGILMATSAGLVDVWAQPSTLPHPLLNYLWPAGVGKFPLIPWAGFPLIGAWLGPAIFSEKSTSRQALRAAMAGAAFVIASRFMTGTQSYDAPFVFDRMGWILLALGTCCWLRQPVRGTKWILQFGQLSLWSYTVHLVIVYGSCASFGLDALKPRFSPFVATLGLGVVLFITALVVRWRAKSLQRQAEIRKMPA